MENEKKEVVAKKNEQADLGAWLKLWEYANSSIDESDCSISYAEFVEEGVKIFEVKLKRHTSET